MRSQIRETALDYAKAFRGVPYEWGGDNPQGLDCSGFVGLVLRSVGLMANKQDLTAKGIFDKFAQYATETPSAGCLVLYGRSLDKISHIAIMIDSRHILEAGGGNSKTVDKETADERNAFVRMRPFNYRTPLAIVDPFRSFPS